MPALWRALHETGAHVRFRSNKRDASKLIAKRLTRLAKLAANLDVEAGDDDEVGDDAVGDAEAAGDDPIMQHGHGLIMHVAALLTSVLPDGAQYNGKRGLCLMWILLGHFALTMRRR